MADVKKFEMVEVDGVRYRPEDVPDVKVAPVVEVEPVVPEVAPDEEASDETVDVDVKVAKPANKARAASAK